MKKWLIPVIVIALLAFAFFKWGIGVNNEIIDKEGVAQVQWANVESAYQRRADLIPNLVATVKGYAEHEKETLEGVIKARAEATKTTINAGDMTPEKMAAFQKAQSGITGALSKLMVVVEKYPDLKANQSFLELQSQLEGTENRINVQRNRYNNLAGIYNIFIKKIPTSWVASYRGFKGMSLYKAEAGSEKAPKVEF